METGEKTLNWGAFTGGTDRFAEIPDVDGGSKVELNCKARSHPDIQLFEMLAFRFGIRVSLPSKQKRAVGRRFRKAGRHATRHDFEQCVMRSMETEQRRQLRAIERRKVDQKISKLIKTARKEAKNLVLSQSHPPSRIAGQYEHLIVLAGLPATAFYRTPEWKRTRVDVLRLARHRCMWCGRTSGEIELHVDHITPRVIAPEKAFDLDNLRVLCRPCHEGRHAADHFDGSAAL